MERQKLPEEPGIPVITIELREKPKKLASLSD